MICEITGFEVYVCTFFHGLLGTVWRGWNSHVYFSFHTTNIVGNLDLSLQIPDTFSRKQALEFAMLKNREFCFVSSTQPLAGGAYLVGLLSSVVVVVVVVRQVFVQTCSECLLLQNSLLDHSQTWHNDEGHNVLQVYGEIFQLFLKFKF